MFLTSLFSRMICCPSEQFCFRSFLQIVLWCQTSLWSSWPSFFYFSLPQDDINILLHLHTFIFFFGLKDVKLYKSILLLPLWQTGYLPFSCSKSWIFSFTYALVSPEILLPLSRPYIFWRRVLALVIRACKKCIL